MDILLMAALVIMVLYAGLLVFAFFHFRKVGDTVSADPNERKRKAMNDL
jgi:hypothetical protein